MANTISSDGVTVTIVGLDTDFDWQEDDDGNTLFGTENDVGVSVKSIQFIPAAADERVILLNKSLAGTGFYDSGLVANKYDSRPMEFDGQNYKFYFDADEAGVSVSATSKLIIRSL